MSNLVKLIGTKRLLLLTVLLMVNLILAAFYFLWINPSELAAERRLGGLNGEIATLQNNIMTIKDQMEETRANIPYFERLGGLGFFDNQDRFRAERIIQQIQVQSGVKAAAFAIGTLQDVNDQRATDAQYRLVMSELTVSEIRAFSDIEIYNLIYLLNHNFPGHMRLKQFSVNQASAVTSGNLEQIYQPDADVAFAGGEAVFEWYTMIKDVQPDVPNLGGGAL